MIVCICKNLTKQDIKDLILKNGGNSELVKFKSGIGSICGSCLEEVDKIIKDNTDASD